MDVEAAQRTGEIAGMATAVIGTGLLLAPGPVGRLAEIENPRVARAIGVTDLVIAPGLLRGRPRWPWLVARTVANGATAALLLSSRRPRALATAAALAGLTVADGRAAAVLRRAGR
ncbi:hypothetical protein [Aeromicrobium sp. CTD01-1L150]|uniref:hypothetical protein n=1 Tax=Aeromicrobium sp. CTD01-1L150 TaxID=3341830 RepID=UPI0035BF639F